MGLRPRLFNVAASRLGKVASTATIIDMLAQHQYWRVGELFVTGHDDPVLFQIRLPKQGAVLELIGTRSIPFTGQGIAQDPKTGGLVGINRAKRQVVFVSVQNASP